jgi:hypothetical protein
MRLVVTFLFLCFATFTGTSAYAQMEKLFASYDCRFYEELDLDDQPVDTVSVVAVEASLVAEPEIIITIDTINGWKHWTTIENYTFGKDRGTMPMITELNALHPYFRDKIIALIHDCRQQGIELAVVESYRTHAKQNEYKTMGKKYTRSGAGKSKHQYGLAVDVVPIVDSVATWDNIALWKKIGIVGEKQGLRWGGRWKRPYDPGHFEWTGGITTSELSQGKLPSFIDKDKHYPCIEEDIKLLRKYWKEWEVNQSSLARR